MLIFYICAREVEYKGKLAWCQLGTDSHILCVFSTAPDAEIRA
jgi:hypothetical protein